MDRAGDAVAELAVELHRHGSCGPDRVDREPLDALVRLGEGEPEALAELEECVPTVSP
jgi:hypothetical protein